MRQGISIELFFVHAVETGSQISMVECVDFIQLTRGRIQWRPVHGNGGETSIYMKEQFLGQLSDCQFLKISAVYSLHAYE